MVNPNIALITNVAEAHIENFRSLKEIAKAKESFFDRSKQF